MAVSWCAVHLVTSYTSRSLEFLLTLTVISLLIGIQSLVHSVFLKREGTESSLKCLPGAVILPTLTCLPNS